MDREQIERAELVAQRLKAENGLRKELVARADALRARLTAPGRKRTVSNKHLFADTPLTRIYEEQVHRFRQYTLEYLEFINDQEALAFERLLDAVSEAKDYVKPQSLRTSKDRVFTERQMEIAMEALDRQERERWDSR